MKSPAVKCALVLGAVLLLTYANSFVAGFTLDNRLVLLRDPRLRVLDWTSLAQIFCRGYWWPSFPSDLYRPLTTLSYALNYSLLRETAHPIGYHVVNLVLHWGNAVLLLFLLRRFGGSTSMAMVGALVFALHPVAVESVTNIVGRADLLVTGCILLTMHCHLSAVRQSSSLRRRICQALVAAFSIAGVLCKENGIVVVGAIMLYDFLYRWPSASCADVPAKLTSTYAAGGAALLPSLAIWVGIRNFVDARTVVQWQYFVDNPLARAGLFQRIMTVAWVQGDYLRLLFWPSNLTCDYSYDHVPLYGTSTVWYDLTAWISLIAVLALLLVAWRARRSQRLLSLGMFLYFGCMFPTSNLAKVIGSVMAERFVYLPLVGFSICAAWVFERAASWAGPALKPRRFGGRLLAPTALVCLALAIRTYARNADWRTDLTLWQSAVKVAPDSFKTHKGLAGALLEANNSEVGIDAAMAEGEKGLAILDRPEVATHIEREDVTLFIDLAHIYVLKANLCARRGATDDAVKYGAKAEELLRRAARVERWVDQESRRLELVRGTRPEDIRDIGRADLFQTLAATQFQMHQFGAAFASITGAMRVNPFDPLADQFSAACLRRMGDPEGAAVCDLTAILIEPKFRPAWQDLEAIYRQIAPTEDAVRRDPDGTYRLAGASQTARRDLERACQRYDQLLREENYRLEDQRFRREAETEFHCAPWK